MLNTEMFGEGETSNVQGLDGGESIRWRESYMHICCVLRI